MNCQNYGIFFQENDAAILVRTERDNLAHCFRGWSCNLKLVFFLKLISRIDIFIISYQIALRWLPQDLTDN